MRSIELYGKVQTVLGLIETEKIGVTLPHEHLFIDIRNYFVEPRDPAEKTYANQPLSLENLSWVRCHKFCNLDTLQLNNEDMATKEALLFKKYGGNTIVDATPNNLGRNPSGLLHVSKTAGINVVMGTGYYIEPSYSNDLNMDEKTQEEITEEFTQEILEGVGSTGIRAGIIGELGCSWPLTENEKKVLRAGAATQRRTGAAITIHPGQDKKAPLEILNLLIDEEVDAARIVMGHICYAVSEHADFCQIAETGCYLEWDIFGTDGTHPTFDRSDFDMPGDAGRIRQIIRMINEGYLNRILISQDIAFKHKLACYGGIGYHHILHTILALMKLKGITDEQIHTIMIENPKQVLKLS